MAETVPWGYSSNMVGSIDDSRYIEVVSHRISSSYWLTVSSVHAHAVNCVLMDPFTALCRRHIRPGTERLWAGDSRASGLLHSVCQAVGAHKYDQGLASQYWNTPDAEEVQAYVRSGSTARCHHSVVSMPSQPKISLRWRQ